MKTIPELFFETAKKFSKREALLVKKDGVYSPITYKELSEKVKNFAAALKQLKIKKDDKVAILSENRPEWVISDLGAMSIGAIVVPLHTTFSLKAICNVLNHSKSKIIIVSNADLFKKILDFQKKLPFLNKIIFLEDPMPALEKISKKKIFKWEELLAQGAGKKLVSVPLSPERVCSIIYTSGTTGVPKGVMLTHNNFLSNVFAVNEAIPIKENDIFLSFLPLSHVLERLAGYYTPLLFGATIAYAGSVKQLSQNLKEVKPTILISVPRVFEKFYDAIWDKIKNSSLIKRKLFLWALKQKKNSLKYCIAESLVFRKIRKQLGGRLRLTVSGGAPLNENIARFFFKIGILILEGYGLTETSPVVTVNRENDFKFGTVGKPLSKVEVKISSEKEILVRGPNVMKGYFKNSTETKNAIDGEKWFHTGDLGFIDKDGFLTVIGRKKEIIVTSYGKNIWPEEIERELNHDYFISQSIVIGDNRKFISSLIIPDWGGITSFLKEGDLTPEIKEKLIKDPKFLDIYKERIEAFNQNLSNYEKIVKFKLLVNEFSQEKEELTPTLKLRRHIIEKHYQKEIKEMYSE